MPLSPGTRLGHYDVTALLGEGGMGQVWQATDTQLNRQVALKILPDAFAPDPDRLARFKREAQILASLNHPNIAATYGIEEAEGTRALVLELVEGPTLADWISKGRLPEPGTGQGKDRRPPSGQLGLWLCPLRNAHRDSPVRWRQYLRGSSRGDQVRPELGGAAPHDPSEASTGRAAVPTKGPQAAAPRRCGSAPGDGGRV